MELGANGVWVSVEDGVEVLNRAARAQRAGFEDCDGGIQIIEVQSRRTRSSHESDSSTPSSSSKRQRPLHSAGLVSNCGHQNQGSGFVTSCVHVTCMVCLQSHVKSVVEKSMITLEPSYEEIRIQLLCPEQRCGMELSKADLIHLLGISTVESYENWLRTAYRDLYGAMSSANMINCIKCQQGKAVKCSRMSSIKGKGKAKKNNDANHLQSAASNESIQCPDSWVCTNCEFSWCAACGFGFDSQCKESGSKGSHICSEATNYRINDIVTDLELIYNEYTTGTTRSDDQLGKTPCNKYNTRSRKTGNQPGTSTTNVNYHPSGINLELLTPYMGSNMAKTVWGAGTGFGGHRHEGKSTADKVKKVEKELDCRTESVLKSLANVLKNILSSQLKPILGFSAYVLFKRDNVVGQLLEYLVMNDSMMDICARSALYLQLADLLKTMVQYPELLMILVGTCFQTDIKGGSDVHGNVRSDTSVIKKMKNIYEQAKIIVNRFKDANNDKNVEADLDIARCLLECYEKLAIASEKQIVSTPYVISISEEEDSMTGDCEPTSDQTTSASMEEGSKTIEFIEVSSDHCKNISLYKESLKPLQFGEYPLLGKAFHHHSYSSHFDELGANRQSIDNTGVHNKNRMLHIAKEVASLATNLPLEWESSIHVRVDPVRMDLLKALIVGPKGTPYQNGIFIFDIYLPPGNSLTFQSQTIF